MARRHGSPPRSSPEANCWLCSSAKTLPFVFGSSDPRRSFALGRFSALPSRWMFDVGCRTVAGREPAAGPTLAPAPREHRSRAKKMTKAKAAGGG